MARKSVVQQKKQANNEEDVVLNEDDPDKDVMVGGPLDDNQVIDDAGDTVKKSDLVSINIDGTDYQVDKNTAALFEAQKRTYDRELGEVKKKIPAADPAPRKAADEDDSDYTVKLFTDPKKFLEERDEKIVSRVRTELTQQYQADQSQKEFWSEFYRENPDLDIKKDHRVVGAVLAENYSSWSELPAAQARKKLADATRDTLLDIIGRHKDKTKVENRDRSTTLEGASTAPGSRKAVDVEEGTKVRPSLSAAIKTRRMKRLHGSAA